MTDQNAAGQNTIGYDEPLPPTWPSGPALKLYDVVTDSYRPATQDDLDRLMQFVAAVGRARGLLGPVNFASGVENMSPPHG